MPYSSFNSGYISCIHANCTTCEVMNTSSFPHCLHSSIMISQWLKIILQCTCMYSWIFFFRSTNFGMSLICFPHLICWLAACTKAVPSRQGTPHTLVLWYWCWQPLFTSNSLRYNISTNLVRKRKSITTTFRIGMHIKLTTHIQDVYRLQSNSLWCPTTKLVPFYYSFLDQHMHLWQ